MEINKEFRKVFDDLRQRYIESSPENQHPTEALSVVQRDRVLPLMIDWSGFFAIDNTGTIFLYTLDNLDNPAIENDERIRNTVLFRGSMQYPELVDFVPTKTDSDIVCPHCNGTGIFNDLPTTLQESVICYCGGLGWIPKNVNQNVEENSAS